MTAAELTALRRAVAAEANGNTHPTGRSAKLLGVTVLREAFDIHLQPTVPATIVLDAIDGVLNFNRSAA